MPDWWRVSHGFQYESGWYTVEEAYLDKSGRNTGLAAVETDTVLLRLGDDSPSMRRLLGIQTGQVALAAAAAATSASTRRALLGNIAVGARLDVVVGDVAPVLGLDPEVVAVDAGAFGLARDLDVGALLVGLDDLVAGARAAAAVERVGLDGVGADRWEDGGREGEGDQGDLHFEGVL